jgi:hypothetical protein
MEYTVPLALQDYMTVIFSAIGLTLLTRMVAEIDRELGRMALIGTILTVAGGVFKASGKLVLAMGGPDIAVLNLGLFPLVAPGFTLVAWSLYQVRRHFRDQAPLRRPWLAPLVIIGLFVAGSAALGAAGGPWRVVLIMQATIFNTFLLTMLAVAAWRRQMRGAAVLFILTLAVVLVMSQMARMPINNIGLVWFEQVAQTVAQALFALAAGAYGREMTTTYRRSLAMQPA